MLSGFLVILRLFLQQAHEAHFLLLLFVTLCEMQGGRQATPSDACFSRVGAKCCTDGASSQRI